MLLRVWKSYVCCNSRRHECGNESGLLSAGSFALRQQWREQWRLSCDLMTRNKHTSFHFRNEEHFPVLAVYLSLKKPVSWTISLVFNFSVTSPPTIPQSSHINRSVFWTEQNRASTHTFGNQISHTHEWCARSQKAQWIIAVKSSGEKGAVHRVATGERCEGNRTQRLRSLLFLVQSPPNVVFLTLIRKQHKSASA